VSLFIVALLLIDSYSEQNKAEARLSEEGISHHDKEEHRIRLFRAQRNLYLCGFTEFLMLLCWRIFSVFDSQEVQLDQENKKLKADNQKLAARVNGSLCLSCSLCAC
jgi:B-cell receptor-associated protein 31